MPKLLIFFLTFLLQFFLIVDPVGGMPIFWSITRSNTSRQRSLMIRKAVIIAAFVHLVFALGGRYILDYFGIQISAIKIGGGILLFLIGLEMLYGRTTRTELDEKEEKVAIELDDVSVTPMAIPLLAGPGSITTVLIFSGMSTSVLHYLLLIVGIGIVLLASLLILVQTERITKLLGQLGTKVLVRFMGLMLVFLAVQYVINGVRESLGG